MRMFEYHYELDAVTLNSTRQLLLDRLVYLALSGYTLPVLHRLGQASKTMDVALITHLVLEVSEGAVRLVRL